MTTRPDYPPRLEIMAPSPYDDQLKDLFHSIKKYSICWMAFEMLDEISPGKKKGLVFTKHRNMILMKSKTNKVLARVKFEKLTASRPQKAYRWAVKASTP